MKLCAKVEQLKQRHNRAEKNIDCVYVGNMGSEEQDLATQLLQTQKNQLIDIQKRFERYRYVLPVSGFSGAKCDKILIKSYLLPNLVDE